MHFQEEILSLILLHFSWYYLIFTLSNEINGGNLEFNKGKNAESDEMGNGNEIKALCESSVRKSGDMEVG